MGQFEYGVFAYTWVWFLVFSAVATLGFGDSPVRYVAQLRERGETAHLRGFIRFAPLVIARRVGRVRRAAHRRCCPSPDGLIEHAYLMPMALMAVSIPFACLQSFLEGVGRSYNWTIPALLPVYILRHGLLLVDHGGGGRARLRGDGASTASSASSLTMVISIAYQATAILRRLRRVVEPRPARLPAARMAARLGALRGPLRRAAPFLLRRRARALLLRQPGRDRHLFRRDAHHPGGEPRPLRGDGRHGASLLRQPHARRPRRAAAALPACRGTTFIARHRRGRASMIVAAATGCSDMFGHGFEAGYVPLVILAAGVLARVAAGPAEDMLNMTGHGDVSASTYLAIVVVNVAARGRADHSVRPERRRHRERHLACAPRASGFRSRSGGGFGVRTSILAIAGDRRSGAARVTATSIVRAPAE